jgi:phage gp36-like protein
VTYATRTAYEDEFEASELTQLESGRVGAFAQCAQDADGEINSYLAARYAVPVTPAPMLLIAMALDICRYRLHDERASERIVKRYERAVAWLRDIATGKAALVADDGTPIAEATAPSTGPVAPYAPTRDLATGDAFGRRYGTESCW